MSDKPDDVDEQLRERLLAQKAAELAPDIAARLSTMRREAVAAAVSTPVAVKPQRWVWAALPAAAAALLLFVGVNFRGIDSEFPILEEQESAAAADLELLEDLEFLAWLELEASAGGG